MKTKDPASRASTLSGDPEAATGQPTDMEVICAFMEKRPGPNEHGGTGWSGGRWWYWSRSWMPRELTLDAIHEVEERLSGEQRLVYLLEISRNGTPETGYWRRIHATAATKIKALAAVLRTQVTK